MSSASPWHGMTTADDAALLHAATCETDLRHALRVIAWTWERECMTS